MLKKVSKYLLYIVGVLLLLIGTAYFAFRSAKVQTYITQMFAQHFSKKLHTTIHIDGVDIEFFKTLVLEGLYVEDLHGDTLIYMQKLKVDVDFYSLKRKVVEIENITCLQPGFYLKQYKEEESLNINFLLKLFSNDSADTDSSNWTLICNSFNILNGHFNYLDENIADSVVWGDMEVKDINLDVQNVLIYTNTVFAGINNLSFNEKHGLRVKEFGGAFTLTPKAIELYALRILTPNSSVKANLLCSFNSLSDFNSFMSKVKLNCTFRETIINSNDISYYVSELKGLNKQVLLSGELKGKLNRLRAKKLFCQLDGGSYFAGNISIDGLPELQETFIHAEVNELKTAAHELRKIPLYPFSTNTFIEIPTNFDSLGNVFFSGKYTGFYYDFVAYGSFRTGIGKIDTDISVKSDYQSQNISYNGSVKANNLALGKIIGSHSLIKKTSLDVTVSGQGLSPEKIDVRIDGEVNNTEFMGYAYDNIKVDGHFAQKKFKGNFLLNDPNANIDFGGVIDISGAMPEFSFNSHLKNIYATKLNLIPGADTLLSLGANIDINLKGKNIDDVIGTIKIKDFSYADSSDSFIIDSIYFNAFETESGKKITLNSDIIEGEINGRFNISKIDVWFYSFINPYFPTVSSFDDNIAIPGQDFEFMISLKEKFTALNEAWFAQYRIHPQTRIWGRFNGFLNEFNLICSSPEMILNNVSLEQCSLNSYTENNRLKSNLKFNKIAYNSLSVENILFSTTSFNDTIGYALNWLNADSLEYSGDIKGYVKISNNNLRLVTEPFEIVLGDSVWKAEGFSAVLMNEAIKINDFKISKNNEFIRAYGILSGNTSQRCVVSFDSFKLNNFNSATKKLGYSMDGILNGKLSFVGSFTNLDITSDMDINGLKVNDDDLGNAKIISSWDPENERVKLDVDVKRGNVNTLKFYGDVYPFLKAENFNVNIILNKLKVEHLGVFVDGVMSDIIGRATGNIMLKGSFKKPYILGDLQLQKMGFRLDYTNVYYTFSDVVSLSKNNIIVNNVSIYDQYGNTAILYGNISHKYFRDFNFNLSVKLNKLQCLNTNYLQNPDFYGTAYASGLFRMSGYPDDLMMDIKARVEKNTKINIPIEDSDDMKENSFVVFVNKNITDTLLEEKYEIDLSGIQMNFDLEVTPDAEIQIIFDERVGDVIKARGNANIKMEINTMGDFLMLGEYVIEDGDYLFTLRNIINKKLVIEKGSRIIWNGDPYEAQLDLIASYNHRTSLANLDPVNFEEYVEKIPVKGQLILKKDLLNPEVSFAIDFPNMEDDLKSKVLPYIDTDVKVQKQVSSILVQGRFLSDNTSLVSSSAVANTGKTTLMELASNQFSNLISKNEYFDLGIKYIAGDEISDDELHLQFSTQLFNDRVSIDVSGGNTTTTNGVDQGTATKLVGDFTVEAKISKDGRLRGKFYNRSEENDLLSSNYSYTQGVGIFYRKEFDTFKGLISRDK